MQTRRHEIRGKIIKNFINKSCGFIQLEMLFLENSDLLGIILQAHICVLPAPKLHGWEQGPMHTHFPPVQLISPAPKISLLILCGHEVRNQLQWLFVHDPLVTNHSTALTSVESFNSVCDSIRQSKAFLAGFFPSYAYNSSLRRLRLLSQPICLKQHFIIIFFSTWVQLGFIQPERAEIAMGTLHVTHSDRRVLCNSKTVVSKEFRLKFLKLSG